MTNYIINGVASRLTQWGSSIACGFLVALDGSIDYLTPCFLAILLDVFSAWRLGVRLSRKYPQHADGKFKSEYKTRILYTLIVMFVSIILGNYVDRHVIIGGNQEAVRFVMGVFLFHQFWSVLENWSSENDDNRLARALQRIMVNKAERHLNVTLSDIFQERKEEAQDHTPHNQQDHAPQHNADNDTQPTDHSPN